YEFQMALTNRRLADDVETVFLMPSEQFSFLSSKLLKESAILGADISSFVPPNVEAKLKDRFRS
ncbi:MAG TPA: pantetheine-phosphate adenylyltransferase, partial [Candidatus Omnitrophota bacterium]|nr:pantetheine-phosphate adenylyltransferase [Candidatus Omnitrophota bacterium]